MKPIILLLFITQLAASQAKYNLELHINQGDIVMYLDNKTKNVLTATQQYNYSVVKEIVSPNVDAGYSPLPLMWFDLKDTSTIRYYRSGNRYLVYEIVDKSPGRNNACQEKEENRPVYDPRTGRIFFTENTFLEFTVKQFKEYKLTGKIDQYIPNSIYFIVFLSKAKLSNPNSIEI